MLKINFDLRPVLPGFAMLPHTYIYMHTSEPPPPHTHKQNIGVYVESCYDVASIFVVG